MDLLSPQFWLAALQIVVINILLSGDNAVVIALACRKLPTRQKRWGLIWGALGAIVLRVVLTVFAVGLLKLPWLKIAGGIALVWIGIRLIDQDDQDGVHVKASDQLLAAVWTVIVADLVMSIDNVLGIAAAARGSLVLLVFGLGLSIPLILVGAQLVLKVIERYPVLIVAGGGLLGWIAGELCIDDTIIAAWVDTHAPWLDWAAPLIGVVLVIGIAKWRVARRAAGQVRDRG
ncbi:MAG: TerC family protein [Casimicrobiaceae bacterium]